jgi:hypothetical protein
LGRKLKGGRWMVDQEGVDALEEVEETTYRNAGIAPNAKSLRQELGEDGRMPDEWNRTRNSQGELVGFVGPRPIIRPPRDEDVVGTSGGEKATDSGVMAALARLRQLEKD